MEFLLAFTAALSCIFQRYGDLLEGNRERFLTLYLIYFAETTMELLGCENIGRYMYHFLNTIPEHDGQQTA